MIWNGDWLRIVVFDLIMQKSGEAVDSAGVNSDFAEAESGAERGL